MKYSPLSLFALLLVPSLGFAQVSGGPNSFGYEYTSTTFDWVTAPANATAGPTFDDAETNVTLPWTIDWYGTPTADVVIGDNGAISFQPLASIDYTNDCLPPLFPTFAAPPEVGIFWDDLNISAGGTISSWHDTTAGNNRYIISWDNVPAWGSADPTNGGSFQIHIESSGAIELHWDDTDMGDSFVDDGASATIHIDDGFGGDPLQFSCDTAQTLEGTAIRFTTCNDLDGDGYGDVACGGLDCDDSEATINPGILETCENGVDEDCDGIDNPLDDDADGYIDINCVGGDDCDDGDFDLNPGVDADGDGSNACDDCNDTPGLGAFLFPGNTEVCGDGIDQDCSGADIECGPPLSCADVLSLNPAAPSGVYSIAPFGEPVDVYCDMLIDGGGWTLVASSTVPFQDEAADWSPQLTTLSPDAEMAGVWNGMRTVASGDSDIRFACKDGPASPFMRVDLSFYDIHWYEEVTEGFDFQSCFNEADGLGYDEPAPARRDNITLAFLPEGDDWNASGYLEGENGCGTAQFTIDFDDRGVAGDPSDGTDWGMDDVEKCGTEGAGGAWFIFVRE